MGGTMPTTQTIADNQSVPLQTEGIDPVEVEVKEKTQEKQEVTQEKTPSKPEIKVEETEKTEELSSESEVEQYSSTVQKRIDRLTRKMREAERREQAALDYAKSVQSQKEALEQKQQEVNKNYQTERSEALKSQLSAAKTKYKAAYESGDTDKIIEANEELSRLQVAQANNSVPKDVIKEEKSTKNPAASPKPEEKPKVDPKAEEWASKNTWFGKDEPMTYAAFGVHKRLVEVEGFDPTSDEYYTEITNRMKEEFPHKFSSGDSVEEKPKRIVKSAVAPADRNVRSGRKTVKLTPSQVAIATKLGVPLEEYAKHVKEA